ncbi:hypothetical protein [Cellulophaga omnivescoria]|uniref:hypothetical protein n=1 Tax=Cellulophaga omnivescoria TaxID=1888890 RepID=UPI0022F0E185|nr:hypothetical protein [Cellulophaga omnivescoria]WBU89662.1 hypothetical protein PBN93_01255 [Cellulophaga omnivescoria]WKB81686.1 hypothetical protein QYR09_01260 [Cellulophaga lytica]
MRIFLANNQNIQKRIFTNTNNGSDKLKTDKKGSIFTDTNGAKYETHNSNANK